MKDGLTEDDLLQKNFYPPGILLVIPISRRVSFLRNIAVIRTAFVLRRSSQIKHLRNNARRDLHY